MTTQTRAASQHAATQDKTRQPRPFEKERDRRRPLEQCSCRHDHPCRPGYCELRLPQTLAAWAEWSRPGEGFQKASRSSHFSEAWGWRAEAALECFNVTWPGARPGVGWWRGGRVEMEHGADAADRRRPDLLVPWLRTPYSVSGVRRQACKTRESCHARMKRDDASLTRVQAAARKLQQGRMCGAGISEQGRSLPGFLLDGPGMRQLGARASCQLSWQPSCPASDAEGQPASRCLRHCE